MNPQQLTDSTSVKQTLTFPVPHVLLEYEPNDSFPILTLRQGGPAQVEHTVTTDYYDAPVDEKADLFLIKAKNQINFGALRLEVLNDAIKDKAIAPSNPTASEYMAKVGKTVLISFMCQKSEAHSRTLEKDVFQVTRITIPLP